MSAAAGQAKTNGAAHHAAPATPAPGSPGEMIARWVKSEIERCGKRLDSFELMRVAYGRPDLLVQPYAAPDAAGAGELVAQVLDRMQYEATHVAGGEPGAFGFALVSRPDGARIPLPTSTGLATTSPDESLRLVAARVTEISSRHSIDLAEVTRDVLDAYKDQRSSEQTGFTKTICRSWTTSCSA